MRFQQFERGSQINSKLARVAHAGRFKQIVLSGLDLTEMPPALQQLKLGNEPVLIDLSENSMCDSICSLQNASCLVFL